MNGKRWVAGVLGGVVAAGLVAGCGTPPPPRAAPGPTAGADSARTAAPVPPHLPYGGAPPSAAAPDGPCPEGGVRLREGAGDAAMGLRVADVQLVNCGAQPYELEGYPEIRVLDRSRTPVEVTVGHGSSGITTGAPALDAPPGKVVLRPGQAASVGLVWRNLVTDAERPAAEGWVLEVVPRPGAPRVALELTRSIDLGSTGKLGVGPWSGVTAR
ncbi:DUF4232 domain-containing protein [Streptomyces sp. NPDC006326]|uniref:DUF4232 domain-containing protein n=1 Tax=Streptomyces sp. NPDC006326 TaxID=3156752 RepID=UPI0033B74611